MSDREEVSVTGRLGESMSEIEQFAMSLARVWRRRIDCMELALVTNRQIQGIVEPAVDSTGNRIGHCADVGISYLLFFT
jgi:hypothetical protein